MPIYEYKCSECEKISEVLVRSSESSTVKCEYCESDKVEKVFSVPGSVGVKESAPDFGGCCGMDGGAVPPCAGSGKCCL